MSSPQRSAGADDQQRRKAMRLIVGASFGNFIENYDYAVYGLLVAPLTVAFFPKGATGAAVLTTLAIFGVSFAARPFGGIFFGRMADRVGRRTVLAIAILMIGAATLVIGLLPTYATVGVWAPILLTVLRLVQGVSAGGEVSNASVLVAEYAPARRRGVWASMVFMTGVLGLLAASGVVLLLTSLLSTDALDSWGWRVAFIVGGPLSLIGLYLRLRIEDSPIYRAAMAAKIDEPVHAPVKKVLQRNWRQVLQLIALSSLGIASYLVVTYYPVYLKGHTSLTAGQRAVIPTIILACEAVAIVLAAMWGDRVGRKPLLLLAGACALVFAIPGFIFAGVGGFGLALVGGLLIALPLPLSLGNQASMQSELFPTDVRATGVGIGYNVGVMVFTGAGPFVAAALLSATGNALAPAYMVMVATLLGLWAATKLPNTKGLRLEDLDRAQRRHDARDAARAGEDAAPV